MAAAALGRDSWQAARAVVHGRGSKISQHGARKRGKVKAKKRVGGSDDRVVAVAESEKKE